MWLPPRCRFSARVRGFSFKVSRSNVLTANPDAQTANPGPARAPKEGLGSRDQKMLEMSVFRKENIIVFGVRFFMKFGCHRNVTPVAGFEILVQILETCVESVEPEFLECEPQSISSPGRNAAPPVTAKPSLSTHIPTLQESNFSLGGRVRKCLIKVPLLRLYPRRWLSFLEAGFLKSCIIRGPLTRNLAMASKTRRFLYEFPLDQGLQFRN
jgi:hypothetical protein